jgi:hypothetical protein
MHRRGGTAGRNRDRSPGIVQQGDAPRGCIMPHAPDPYRSNDTKLLTPVLVMGLIIVLGFLYFAYVGHATAG